MAEPLLAVSSIVVAFIAGLIGGYFIGWKEGRTSRLVLKQIERINKLINIMEN